MGRSTNLEASRWTQELALGMHFRARRKVGEAAERGGAQREHGMVRMLEGRQARSLRHGTPVSSAGVVVGSFLAADRVSNPTVAKDFLPHDPRANRPAGERSAVPGGPAGFGFLGLVQDDRG